MRLFSSLIAALLLPGLASGVLSAQSQSFSRGLRVASIVPGPAVKLQPGETAAVPITVRIRPSYHINSNEPADEYLIPTKLTWEPSLLLWKRTDYPEAEIVNYAFSKKPLAVYSNKIVILSHFAVPEKVSPTLTELKGEFRYQACNSRACLPPKTIEVIVPVAPL